MPLLPLLLLAQAAATPMAAEMKMPEPVCIRAGDLPPAFAKWNAAPSKMLTVGAPFVVAGQEATAVKWAIPAPANKPGEGAVVWFKIAKAGTYRIGLSEGAWIDVVAKGKALESAAHGHGPICTGLRKIVDFKLAPGSYALQLAGMPADTIKMMIVAK